MKGLAEVLGEHGEVVIKRGKADRRGIAHSERQCSCGEILPWSIDEVKVAHRAHLADVVLAWVAAGLDGAREGVWEWLPYSKIPEASDADAVLDIIRGALGVPQEATGADLSDEGRSVGFGDGSDDEGGSE